MNLDRFPIEETVERMVDKYLGENLYGRNSEIYASIREDYICTIVNNPDYIGLTSWTEEILLKSDVDINDDLTKIAFCIPNELLNEERRDLANLIKLFESIRDSARKYHMSTLVGTKSLMFIFTTDDDACNIPLFSVENHKLEVYRPNMVLYSTDERY